MENYSNDGWDQAGARGQQSHHLIVDGYHISSSIQPIYFCKTLISMKKHEEKKKDSHRVQTTQDVSFGPVFIVPALPISYLVENNLFAL